MKKLALHIVFLLTLGGALTACRDEDRMPAPAVENLPIIFPQLTPGKDFFDYTAARLASGPDVVRPVFEFTIDPGNQRDVKLQTVEVYRSYRRGSTLGPRIKVGDYSSFPATITINSKDAIADLQRLANTTGVGNTLNPTQPTNRDAFNNLIVPNDAIVFTFEYVLEDGRRIILTPLMDVKLANGTVIQVPSGTLATTAPGSAYPYAAVAVFRNK